MHIDDQHCGLVFRTSIQQLENQDFKYDLEGCHVLCDMTFHCASTPEQYESAPLLADTHEHRLASHLICLKNL